VVVGARIDAILRAFDGRAFCCAGRSSAIAGSSAIFTSTIVGSAIFASAGCDGARGFAINRAGKIQNQRRQAGSDQKSRHCADPFRKHKEKKEAALSPRTAHARSICRIHELAAHGAAVD
jgi:hypothetical protein